MTAPIRMTARRADLVLGLSSRWELQAVLRGDETPEPAELMRDAPGARQAAAEAWSLVSVSVLTPVGVDTYTPGPRWDEAVAAAEAFEGARS